MSYIDDEIQVLTPIESIRRRPALYLTKPHSSVVCDLNDPTLFNRLIRESLCLSIDEAVSGYCTQVQVSVSAGNDVTIRDNGRGLSMMPKASGQVPAEDIFRTLYACRTNKENARLKQSCCEMGIVVVNALSEWFHVRNCREGSCWIQEYHYGVPQAPFRCERETVETGLELSFRPDVSLLSSLHFDESELAHWVHDIGAGFGDPKVTKGVASEETIVLVFETTTALT